MKSTFSEIFGGLKSLATGMRITLGEFFKPTVTVHYPHEALKMPARYRGHIELVRDPDTNLAACIVCKLCEKACPSDCITVDGIKPEGFKKKTVTVYNLDFTKCSLCGSCVEVCRDGAIQFSRDYNSASTNKGDYVMDLLKRLQDQTLAKTGTALYTAETAPKPAPAPAPAASAPAAPAAAAPAAAKPAAAPAAATAPAIKPTAPATPAAATTAPAASNGQPANGHTVKPETAAPAGATPAGAAAAPVVETK